MRYGVGTFLLFMLIWLTGCGPGAQDEAMPASFNRGTGLISNSGAPFSDGNDFRAPGFAKAIEPKNPANPTPEEKNRVLFYQSLSNFTFLRYDSNAVNATPTRDGKARFSFQVSRTDEKNQPVTVTFSASGPALKATGNTLQWTGVAGSVMGYSLDGVITDGKDACAGTITLHYGSSVAIILVRGYRTSLTIHQDLSADLNQTPDLKSIVDDLAGAKYTWALNLVVPDGASRFQYSIMQDASSRPILSFAGDSVQTGIIDALPSPVVGPQTPVGQHVKSIEEAGDTLSDGRTFAIKLQGQKGGFEVMADMDRNSENPDELLPLDQRPKPLPAATEPTATPAVELAPGDIDMQVTEPVSITPPAPEISSAPQAAVASQPAPISAGRPQSHLPIKSAVPAPPTPPVKAVASNAKPIPPKTLPTEPARAAAPSGPTYFHGVSAEAYLATDYNNSRLPMTQKVIRDWEKNCATPQTCVSTVQYWINQWTTRTAVTSTSYQLVNFYRNIYPLKNLIEATATKYDFPPAYAYLMVRESPGYLANYKIQVNPETEATGPFQFLRGTMTGLGFNASDRNYFATSACAGAKYMNQIARDFSRGDTTVGIMGYYQGPSFKYPKLKRKAQDFSYTFADIVHRNLGDTKGDWVAYVSQVLAAYFISGNPTHYGFNLAARTTQRPANTFPPAGDRFDQVCEGVITGFRNTAVAIQ